jgi:gamma-glutamyltranspeptidase/glutathione hydrolase
VDKERFSARGAKYAVATPHTAATQAAVAAFAAGGNAVDAAVAANAVLAVVYPHMCGIGGDLFAVIANGDGATVLNGSGAAALAIDADRVKQEYGAMPVHGPLSVSVPGTIAAWADLVGSYGRLPFGAALKPAFAHAQDGIPVAASVARAIVKHADRLAADSGMRSLFLPNGHALGERDQLRQPALAATLRAIADAGPEAFYDGPIGQRFVSGLRKLGSPLTPDDLRRHATETVAPLERPYRGHDVLVPPPNSQGFVLEEILGCIEQGHVEPDHLGREAPLIALLFLLASGDRDRFLADPRRTAVPIDTILSAQHAREVLDDARRGIAPKAVGQPASGDTVGIVAADESGLWVSINQSLYNAFGSGILESETGIIAHNRGSYFSLDRDALNFLQGGKRPAHTLMPVLLRKDGAPMIASATMGGSAHAQIHAELLMAIIDQGRDALSAIDLPRWLVGGLRLQQDGASGVVAERRVADSVRASLTRAGIAVDLLGEWDEEVGHAQLIVREPDGRFHAASDPRADGAAACG